MSALGTSVLSLRYEQHPQAKVDLFKRCQLLAAADAEDTSHACEGSPLGLGTVFSLTKQMGEMHGDPFLILTPFPFLTPRADRREGHRHQKARQ